MTEQKTAAVPELGTKEVQEARQTVDALAPMIRDFLDNLKAMGRQYAMEGKDCPDYFTFAEAADLFFTTETEVFAFIMQEHFCTGYDGHAAGEEAEV